MKKGFILETGPHLTTSGISFCGTIIVDEEMPVMRMGTTTK